MARRLASLVMTLCLAGAVPAGEPRTDSYGDPLPEGALARLGTIRGTPGERPAFFAFLPGGKELLTVDRASRVARWEVPSGKLLAEFRALPRRWERSPDAWPSAAAVLSPDGKSVVVSNDAGVHLWDVASGTEQARFPVGRDFVEKLVFLPEGKVLVGVGDNRLILLWDRGSGKLLSKLNLVPEEEVVSVTGSPDGVRLQFVTQTPGTLSAYHFVRGSEWELEQRPLSLPRRGWRNAAVLPSPDGQWLTCVDLGGRGVELIEADSLKVVRSLESVGSNSAMFGFSADGKQVLGRFGPDTLVSWETASGKLVKVEGTPPRELSRAEAAGKAPFRFVASPDGRWLVETAAQRRLSLRDRTTGKVEPLPCGHDKELTQVAVTPDGATVRVMTEGQLHSWDLATGRATCAPRPTTFQPELSPCGRYALRRPSRGAWRVCRLDPREEGADEVALSEPVSGEPVIAFSGNGDYLALREASRQRVVVFETATGASVGRFPIPDVGGYDGVSAPALVPSHDGRWFLAASGDRVPYWHVPTQTRHELADGPKRVSSAAFTPDGRSLALVESGDRVTLWETATGRRRAVVQRPLPPPRTRDAVDAEITSLAFSPDGRLLALGLEGGAVEWWDAHAGRLLGVTPGHRGRVTILRFTADGKRLVSGSGDLTALVWDAEPWRAKLPQPAPLGRERRAECWGQLAEANAERAWGAVRAFANDPGAVGFLAGRMPPATGPDRERIGRWLRDLDSDDFGTRRRARESLEKEGRAAVPFIEAALNAKPPAEVRRQLEGLLAELRDAALTAEELRQLRAVEVLEAHRAADALRKLAEGERDAFLTRQAREALERLGSH